MPLYELARGVDESAVIPDRPTQSISVEDTFEHDVRLSETESMIRRLAEKFWSASRKESRIARIVMLKPKTSEFKILTRSHTTGSRPSSYEELTEIAVKLRERMDLGLHQRYRLVGVGLSKFRDEEGAWPLRFSIEEASVRRGWARRLLRHRLHHLQHSLLHLFRSWLSLVRTHHPAVTVRVHDGAATVAPEHVHDGPLAGRSELGRLIDYLVDVFDIDVETGWRGANALGGAPSHRGVFGTEHEGRAAQGQFGMNRLGIRTVHDATLGEAKRPLVKADRGWNIGDCERGGDRAIRLLVQRIDLSLCHSTPFVRTPF